MDAPRYGSSNAQINANNSTMSLFQSIHPLSLADSLGMYVDKYEGCLKILKFLFLKILSKNLFLTLLCLFLTFNFSKNISRIIQKNYINFGIDKVNNKYVLYDDYNSKNAIPVFRPDIELNELNGNGWQGRLCWDIPFICSYSEIKVNLINNYYFISK